ncbi:MAG: metal-dependent hydrolase [Candidatus Micrarchaeota archaeon]
MNWKAHVTIAIFLALFLFYFMRFPFEVSLPLVIFAGLSALVPDLDHDMSKGRQMLNYAVFGYAIAFSYSASGSLGQKSIVFFAIIGAYFLIITFLKPRHRGIVHSILVCVLYSLLVYVLIGLNFAIAGFVGYFSHLLADKEMKLI